MAQIWKFLAGLGIFLFGLQFLEQSLRALAGRPFKTFLRRQTTTPLKGILGGIGVTAVLQSSTLISVMIVAFVGAGILTFYNAIGVIFGANLGTTATGWIVATLGFDLDIEKFALPLIALGGLALIFFEQYKKVVRIGRLLLGFGFLFFGLSYMKEPIEVLAEHTDNAIFSRLHPYVFYPIGVMIAALIQSGSAVMVMGLTAVSAGLIPLEAAAALAIGGDLGKTSTAILSSLRGTAVQKQVAASHVLFNFCTNLLALALLYPLIHVITEWINVQSPLYALVTFHSTTNLLGIIALFPFVHRIADFLGKKFLSGNSLTEHIDKVPTTVSDAAVEALHLEVLNLADKVVALNLEGLGIEEEKSDKGEKEFNKGEYTDHYEAVKQLQGETLKYFLRIQNERLEPEDSARLNKHANALRYLLKSAKRLKDVTHNIRDFEASGNDHKHRLFTAFRDEQVKFYSALKPLLKQRDRTLLDQLSELVRENRKDYENILAEAYHASREGHLSEVEMATFQNAAHEIYSSNKALMEGLGEVLLNQKDEQDFEALPELS